MCEKSHLNSSNLRLIELGKIKQAAYNLDPKKCKHCNTNIDYNKKINNFCNSSCAASFNNALKPKRTEASRKNTSNANKKYKEKLNISKGILGEYSKICFPTCKSCNKIFLCKGWIPRKTCSDKCYRKNLSILASKRLSNPANRKNYGRKNPSYMESSFTDWLNSYNIIYETEVHFKNHILNKNYYVDFLFEDIKLIIELDGTQHRKTIEEDKIRDQYITNNHGYRILRIPYSEYKKKTKIALICELLGIVI